MRVFWLAQDGPSPVTPHLRALSRFGHAIIWEILNSLENSWKMLEGLAGTARRKILVCRWWVERPRLRKSSDVSTLIGPTAMC
jgi:hypothetical protein